MLSDCTAAIASSAPLYVHQLHPIHAVVALLSVRSLRDPSAATQQATAIYDRIVSDRLLCAVVETWLDAVDSPQLIACTPPGYSYIEKARPRSASAALTTHAGLWLFYASFISAPEVPLPVCNSGIEVLIVYLRRARRNALAVVIYRPPTPPSVHF